MIGRMFTHLFIWGLALLMWGFAIGSIQVIWEERKTRPITFGCAAVMLLLLTLGFLALKPDRQFYYPTLLLAGANGILMAFFGWFGYYFVTRPFPPSGSRTGSSGSHGEPSGYRYDDTHSDGDGDSGG